MSPKGEFRLFVGNLAAEVDSDLLLRAFECCGAISAKVATDHRSGKPLGFGHVDFETEEEAKEGVQRMNGRELEGRSLFVHVDKLYQGSKSVKVKRTGIAGAAAAEAVAIAASKSQKSPAPSPRGSLTHNSSRGRGWDWLSGVRFSFQGKTLTSSKSFTVSHTTSWKGDPERSLGKTARSKSMSMGSMNLVSPTGKHLSPSRSQKSTNEHAQARSRNRMDSL